MSARIAAIALALVLVWASGHQRDPGPGPLEVSAAGAIRPAPATPAVIIDARDLTPGSRRAGTVAVAGGGRTIRALQLRPSLHDEPGPGGGRLSRVLLVEIAELRGRAGSRRLWKGTLRALPGLAVGRLERGRSRVFQVTLTLPKSAGDEVQGSAITFELHATPIALEPLVTNTETG